MNSETFSQYHNIQYNTLKDQKYILEYKKKYYQYYSFHLYKNNNLILIGKKIKNKIFIENIYGVNMGFLKKINIKYDDLPLNTIYKKIYGIYTNSDYCIGYIVYYKRKNSKKIKNHKLIIPYNYGKTNKIIQYRDNESLYNFINENDINNKKKSKTYHSEKIEYSNKDNFLIIRNSNIYLKKYNKSIKNSKLINYDNESIIEFIKKESNSFCLHVKKDLSLLQTFGYLLSLFLEK